MWSTRERADDLMTLSNLVSRLKRRYSMHGDLADHAEVVELLQELQSLSPSESVESGPAIIHLRQMAAERVNKTDAVDDLGEALEQITTAIGKLPKGYEGSLRALTRSPPSIRCDTKRRTTSQIFVMRPITQI